VWLYRVDHTAYVGATVPSVRPGSSRIPGCRRRYKLAYQILVHGDSKLAANLEQLLDELDDGTAVFLVHVDKRHAKLRAAIDDVVRRRDARMRKQRAEVRRLLLTSAVGYAAGDDDASEKLVLQENGASGGGTPGDDDGEAGDIDDVPGNVFLSQTPLRGQWGHVSLVRIQLSGYWELLDLADWDHVINLSVFDYPLRRSAEIQRLLGLPANRGKSWIDTWEPQDELVERLSRPRLAHQHGVFGQRQMASPQSCGALASPLPRWRVVKHHQWMTLARDFVEFLRHDDQAATAFAHFEWGWIVDESFIGTVAVNSAQFADRLEPGGARRFVHFSDDNTAHAAFVDDSWVGLIGEDHVGGDDNKTGTSSDDPRYMFVRKVDGRSDGGARWVEWARRLHLDRHVLGGVAGGI
ncbi:hypothetical protein HK405_015549, partial [Cladochytrium tenue]